MKASAMVEYAILGSQFVEYSPYTRGVRGVRQTSRRSGWSVTAEWFENEMVAERRFRRFLTRKIKGLRRRSEWGLLNVGTRA